MAARPMMNFLKDSFPMNFSIGAKLGKNIEIHLWRCGPKRLKNVP
jgi:hypothetical protein